MTSSIANSGMFNAVTIYNRINTRITKPVSTELCNVCHVTSDIFTPRKIGILLTGLDVSFLLIRTEDMCPVVGCYQAVDDVYDT